MFRVRGGTVECYRCPAAAGDGQASMREAGEENSDGKLR